MHYFGDYIFNPETGELTHGDKSERLEPTIARLLEYFLVNQERLITRDELIEKVWLGRIVSDEPVNRGVSLLRQALNADDKQAFIETLPRKGYKSHFPSQPEQVSGRNTDKILNRKNALITMTVVLLLVLLAAPWVDVVPQRDELPSVAVLPFTDLTPDGQYGYLTEGISDTVIHLLSRVDEMDVTARTSSFAFKDKNLTVRQIASELDVQHLLEGSLQVQGERVRLIARLVEGRTESEVWSESFERHKDNIFSIQDDIAEAVVIALKGTVIEDTDEYQPDFETYQLVLKGKQEYNKATHSGYDRAEQLFRRAISSEPEYPLPYVLLARTLKTDFDTNSYTHIYPSEAQLASLEETEFLIDKALQLNPFSSEAHNLRGLMLMNEGEMVSAGAALVKSIELEPNNADALGDHANWLQMTGQLEQAVITARKAVALGPRSSRLQQILAQNLWTNGRSEQAISVIEQNLKNNPTAANNNALLGRWALQLGQPGHSLIYSHKEWELDPDNPNRWWGVCLSYLQLWDFDEGQRCSEALLDRFPDYYEARKHQQDLKQEYKAHIIEEQIALFPAVPYYRLQLADWLMLLNRYEEAVETLKPVYPTLLTSEPEINDWSLWAIRIIGGAMNRLGQQDQTAPLLEAGLNYLDASRKMQAGGFSAGVDDACYLVLLSRYDQALDRLESAIDNNWSMYSMWFDQDFCFEPIVDEPRFQNLVERHKAFMAQEREWASKQLETGYGSPSDVSAGTR